MQAVKIRCQALACINHKVQKTVAKLLEHAFVLLEKTKVQFGESPVNLGELTGEHGYDGGVVDADLERSGFRLINGVPAAFFKRGAYVGDGRLETAGSRRRLHFEAVAFKKRIVPVVTELCKRALGCRLADADGVSARLQASRFVEGEKKLKRLKVYLISFFHFSIRFLIVESGILAMGDGKGNT